MTKRNAYDRFERIERRLSAYWIGRKGGPASTGIGRVIVERSPSGGRVRAFVQVWGEAMADASAGGHDLTTEAVRAAILKLPDAPLDPQVCADITTLQAVAKEAGSDHFRWHDLLDRAGFIVQRVI